MSDTPRGWVEFTGHPPSMPSRSSRRISIPAERIISVSDRLKGGSTVVVFSNDPECPEFALDSKEPYEDIMRKLAEAQRHTYAIGNVEVALTEVVQRLDALEGLVQP